jgi:misacylated tRNA(Ala) deacylase
MTRLLFQTDSYLNEFEAVVQEADAEAGIIFLDQTAFYPGGGGQPCDTGQITFNGHSVSVTKAKWQAAFIAHWLDGNLPPVDTKVIGQIDWERRYQLMRVHTALHILCGVVWRDYGAQVTGGNMEPLKGRMDFEFETVRAELVKEIEEKVNIEVEKGHEVKVRILPREEAFQIPDLIRTKINLLPESLKQIRTVEIVGLDLQADGGTHVKNTREVGRIHIVGYKSKGRINKRIQIALDP